MTLSAYAEHESPMAMISLCVRVMLLTALATFSSLASTQEISPHATELIAGKGGYVEKKRLLEDMRLRAYVPILLRAVGKGSQWNPSHPRWRTTELRITADWLKLNDDYARSLGRDPSYAWFDNALAREYSAAFSADELAILKEFHGSSAGRALLDLERELLTFYPGEMVLALARAMGLNEPLSGQAQDLFQSPESRARRDFLALFETDVIIREEALRLGGAYVQASYPTIQQSAIAAAAPRIDELRARLTAGHRISVVTFINSELGRRERAFLGRAAPVALSAPEDPRFAMEQESAFYANLAKISAQWKTFAAE